jgi:hypothetical protein
MNIFGHDGDPLGMDGTQVGVLEETHEIGLCCLLQSKDRMALETQVTLQCIYMKLHSDITNVSKEKPKDKLQIDPACGDQIGNDRTL